jgi:hypothetical protein
MRQTVLSPCRRSKVTELIGAARGFRRPTASIKGQTEQPLESHHEKKPSMKRAAASGVSDQRPSKAKERRVEIPDYHLTPSTRSEQGEIIWPAPIDQIERARAFILEWFVIAYADES